MFKAKKQKGLDRQKALDGCKKQGIDDASKECTKFMYEERRKKFVTMFQEIRAWNAINKFVNGM